MSDIRITPGSGSIGFTGSAASNIHLQVQTSGSVSFMGTSGSLLSISDTFSGSLFSVSDASGLPYLDVRSDSTIHIGDPFTPQIIITGSAAAFTGSLEGTSSFAISASYAPPAATPTLQEVVDVGASSTTGITLTGGLISQGGSSITTTILGSNAGNALIGGTENTLIGYQAGRLVEGGIWNTCIGSYAGYSIPTGGQRNTYIGRYAGFGTTGNFSTSIGAQAGQAAGTNAQAVSIGYAANQNSTNSGNSVVIGMNAAVATLTTNSSTIVGYECAYEVTDATHYFILGNRAARGATSQTKLTAIGYQTAENCSGSGVYNIFIGYQAALQTGVYATGNHSIGLGYQSLIYATELESQIALGQQTLMYSTGSYNTAIGIGAGKYANTRNIMIGYQSGMATNGSDNIYLGYQVGKTSLTGSNQLAIDVTDTANPLIYGEFDNNILRFNAETTITGSLYANSGVFVTGSLEVSGSTKAHRPTNQEGSSFTVGASHLDSFNRISGSGAVVITVNDTTLALGADAEFDFFWESSGISAVSFATGSTVGIISSLNALALSARGSAAHLKRLGTSDNFALIGDLV